LHSSLAITFFEKDDLHMEPTQVHLGGCSPCVYCSLSLIVYEACNSVELAIQLAHGANTGVTGWLQPLLKTVHHLHLYAATNSCCTPTCVFAKCLSSFSSSVVLKPPHVNVLLLLQMAIADTIAGLPWTVKPLYGFITDSFPIRGEPLAQKAAMLLQWYCHTQQRR
jgi:hypothetical protein